MGLFETLGNKFSHEAMKYKTVFLPDYRVDAAYDSTPIKAGEAYCRIWLADIHLERDVEWFKRRYPVVHAAVRFHHGNEVVTIPYIAEPGHLRSLGTGDVGTVIQSNYPITPLFPFNQGLVELQAGLFSMVSDDPVAKFIKIMGRFSELLPVPELSSVVKLAQPIYQGIEELLDIGDRQLELVYQQAFTDASGGGGNLLRAGYFAVILAEEHQFNSDTLCVVSDRLQVGSPGPTKMFLRDRQPLTGYSYMLFRIEKKTQQDWESLTKIKELVYLAQDAVYAQKYEEVKATLIPAIRTSILRSPDIAKSDRQPMILKIEETLKEQSLQSPELQRRSLYSIMQRPLPAIDAATKAELASLERLFA